MFKSSLRRFFTSVLVGVLLAVASPARSATLIGDYLASKDIEVGVSATMDVYNKYVWRGFLLDDDTVLQPSLTISVAGFEGGFWGNWDVENDDSLKSDEVDGWIGYAFDLGFLDESLEILGMKFGHTWYAFPELSTGLGDGAHSREFYAGITLDTFLSPYFTWYHDYEDESSGGADGDYFTVGIGHSFTLNEEYGIALNLGYEFSYNNEAFIADDGGYNLLTAGLGIPLTDQLTITPKIGYSMPFGDVEDASNDEFFVGVSTGFSI